MNILDKKKSFVLTEFNFLVSVQFTYSAVPDN